MMFARVVQGSILSCLSSLLILSQLYILFGAIQKGKLDGEIVQSTTSNAIDTTIDTVKSVPIMALSSNDDIREHQRRLYPRFVGPRQKYNQMVGRALEPARLPLINICQQGLTKIKATMIEKLPSILKDVLTEVFAIPKKILKKQKNKEKSNRFVLAMRKNKYKLKEKFTKAFAHKDDSSKSTDDISMNAIASSSTKQHQSIKAESSELAEKSVGTPKTTTYPLLIATIAKSVNFIVGKWQQETTEIIAKLTAELTLHRIYLKLSMSPKMVVPVTVTITGVDRGPEAQWIEELRHAMKTGTAISVELNERINSATSSKATNTNKHTSTNGNNNQANSASSSNPSRTPASTMTGIRGMIRRIIDAALDKLLNWIYPDIDVIIEGSLRATIEIIMKTIHISVLDTIADQLRFCGKIVWPIYDMKWTRKLVDMGVKITNWPSDIVLSLWNRYRHNVLSKETESSIASEDINPAQVCANIDEQISEISTKLDYRMSSYLENYTNDLIVDLQKKGRKATRVYISRKIHKIIPVFSDLVRPTKNVNTQQQQH